MKTNRFSRSAKSAMRPNRTDGYVYYVRLKTDLGMFYKLGFTTLTSVAERLAYQGTGDERLIDEVLMFVYLDDGYDVETALHQHFKVRAAFSNVQSDPNLPLHRNGQSELYIDDILSLDQAYRIDQAHATRRKIRLAEQGRINWRVQEMGGPRTVDPDVAEVMDAIRGPATWLIRAYTKFCMFFASEGERVRQAAHDGRHYLAKIPASPAIEAILERLATARFNHKIATRMKRDEETRRMLQEAGLTELPVRPRR